MKLYFGGAEVPGWRNILADAGVPAVSLSFVGLSRRVKHLENWRIADKFPDGQAVFLDSGAYSLNKEGADYSDEQAYALAEAYAAFVAANIGRIEMFSEFDALQLDPSRLLLRAALMDISVNKFMPIWHPRHGADELEGMAEWSDRLGVLQPDPDALDNLAPVLRRLAVKTKLHGVAMTRMEVMKAIPWDSVGSTSWLSPSQYGDTFVWTGRDLKRYPKRYKDNARKRHRTLFESKDAGPGLSAEKIAADDTTEVLRLSIWSWSKFVEDIERHREDGVVTPSANLVDDGIPEPSTPPVGTGTPPGRNEELGSGPRPRQLLPVLSIIKAPAEDGEEGGEEGGETEARIGVRDSNLMQCSNCYLKGKCPQYRPGEECAYDIPMYVTTTTQVRALRKAILAMQAQRVAMMRMMEQVEGGYADQNASAEIQRLWRMIRDDEDADRDHASFEIKVTGSGESGMISRIFGGDTADKVAALPAPQQTNDLLAGYDIVDAELVEEAPVPRNP